LLADVAAAACVLVAVSGHSLVPMMLLVNVGIATLLLPRRAYLYAALAALGVLVPYFLVTFYGGVPRSAVETGAVVVAYFVVAALLRYVGGHVRATEDLAAQRGVDLLNLEQI